MIAEQLVEKALGRAARGTAEASLRRSEWTNVSFENSRLKSVSTSQSTHAQVRVIVDGKLGASHTTDVTDRDGVAERAIEAARFGSPVHFDFSGPAELPEVNVHDPHVPTVTKEDMVRIGEEMMALVLEYNPGIVADASISKRVGRSEIATSAGAAYATDSTSFSVYVGGQWIRGTDILWAGHSFGWRKRDIDHKAVARNAVEWFRLAENTAQIRSGDMPVIFTPDGADVLLLALVLGINGKSVVLGSSPLKDRLGETIADARFTLVDNPLIDYANGSSRYDGEGVPRRVTPIIENGVLRNFLYDLDAAGRAGVRSTGHGPGCGTSNLVLKEGDTPYERMIAETQEGLLVHNVMGLGQGNALSGAFSVNVELGYKIKNGRIVGRVKDVMLAGNAYDALKDIVAIGLRAEWINGAGGPCLLPPIKVGGLSVVAK